jgi:hypothetical protein
MPLMELFHYVEAFWVEHFCNRNDNNNNCNSSNNNTLRLQTSNFLYYLWLFVIKNLLKTNYILWKQICLYNPMFVER